MRRQLRTVAAALALVGLLGSGFAVPVVAAPSDWVVDDDRAQCGKADFTSIAEAMADERVSDGDIVRVCPGLYTDSVTVSKSITLKGDPEAIDAIDCFSLNLPIDPASHAIVDPVSRVFAGPNQFGLKLRANGIDVSGLVFQDGYIGVDASDAFSGYRIHHNLFKRHSYFAVEFGSNGETRSRADHNCFWENAAGPGEIGGGLGSELDDPYLNILDPANRTLANARNLANARIDHNRTYRNNESLVLFGPGFRDGVLIDNNVQRDDRIGIGIQHSESSAILENDIAGPDLFPPRPPNFVTPILVSGDNEGLEIGHNVLQGGRNAMVFQLGLAFDIFPVPSHDLWIHDNVITGAARHGFAIAPPATTGAGAGVPNLVDSTFENNTSSGNRFHGFLLSPGSTGNVVRGNVLDENDGSGVYVAPGADANTFEANSMHGNGTVEPGELPPSMPPLVVQPFVDARDDSWPANTWIDNNCATDSPVGELCDLP